MIVIDTHVLVWAVEGDPRLGETASLMIEDAAANGRVLVPAIALWEIAMLVAKDRLALAQDIRTWTERVLELDGIEIAPLAPSISLDAVSLPGTFHADPADRMIVATARYYQATLLTADRQILAYAAAGHLIARDAQG